MATNFVITENGSVEFGSKFIKVTLSNDARVAAVKNLITGEDMLQADANYPWISYIRKTKTKDEETLIKPTSLEADQKKFKVNYEDGSWATFTVAAKDNYFSMTLLKYELKSECEGLVFANIPGDYEWEANAADKFALSLVPMVTSAIVESYPGGFNKNVYAVIPTNIGFTFKNSKVGIAFSTLDVHREFLKDIVNDIDTKYGIVNKNAGPFTFDSKNSFGDYIITGSSMTADNVDAVGKLSNEYGFEQIAYHQSSYSSFKQGDFNFVGSRTEKEKEKDKFLPAKEFKKRVTDKMYNKYGTFFSIHTYSSLIALESERLLSNPKWQKQICYDPNTFTLKEAMTADDTVIKTVQDATNFICDPYRNMPRSNIHSAYFLIDKEIVRVKNNDETGFSEITRAQCGTKAAAHKAGAEMRQLLGWYNMFQPKPFSELFYLMAKLTAKAYNEGGFKAIYLDGFESFGRDGLSTPAERPYIYAEFYRELLRYCKLPPVLESSSMLPSLWAGRGRYGAVDHAKTEFKQFKTNDTNGKRNCPNWYYTATLGWFNPCPDYASAYKNNLFKTMFRDDLDHMASIGVAYNFGTCNQPFNVDLYNKQTRFRENVKYYNAYSMLRKAKYFSPEVKDAIKDPEFEYKIFKKDDGAWAFKQMRYFKNRVFDYADKTFASASATNPFGEQTPYVRIEQKYSTMSENEMMVLELGEQNVADVAKKHELPNIDISRHNSLKVKVQGNGRDGAILITLESPRHVASARTDYFIPTNFEGTREFILVDSDNANYNGHSFEGINASGILYECFRGIPNFANLDKLTISVDGDVDGVKIGDIKAYEIKDVPAKNPSVTIGDSKITFNTELHSGEFIEFYPEYGKAYRNFYEYSYKEDGSYADDIAHTEEITFEGEAKVPAGEFTYTYDAESITGAPLRAQTVVGVSGKVFANPVSWKAPEVNIDDYYNIVIK